MDDDDFEELFSFGNTPKGDHKVHAASAVDDSIDFGLDDDDDEGGDDAPASASSAAGSAGSGDSFLNVGVDLHGHDADTREFLDFLDVDDGGGGGKSGGGGTGGGTDEGGTVGADGSAIKATGSVDEEDLFGDLDDMEKELEGSPATLTGIPAVDAQTAAIDGEDSDVTTPEQPTPAVATSAPLNPPSSSFEELDDKEAASPEVDLDDVGPRLTMVALPPVPAPAPAVMESAGSIPLSDAEEETTTAMTNTSPNKKANNEVPPLPPPPPKFGSISDAVRSPLSTLPQLRTMCLNAPGGFYDVQDADRPRLWCKAACNGRTLEEVAKSSVADLFVEWDRNFEKREEGEKKEGEDGAGGGAAVEEEEEAGSLVLRVRAEAEDLVRWIAVQGDDAKADVARSLRSLLLFHFHSVAPQEAAPKDSEDNDSDGAKLESDVEWDPLLGPVAALLLSSGMTPVEASTVLSNLIPTALPLMGFYEEERTEAARSLHGRLYLLACYHLPLLVLHLDRYAPGWHWPHHRPLKISEAPKAEGGGERCDADGSGQSEAQSKRAHNFGSQGTISSSWFVSHLAGRGVGGGTSSGDMMDPGRLRHLWDVLLTMDGSLKFFLALAVLERHSDSLLMQRGDDLRSELGRVMSLEVGGFVDSEEDEEGRGGVGGTGASVIDHRADVSAWYDRAVSLLDSTPSSVLSDLRGAEDDAVQVALNCQLRKAEEQKQAQLEEEAQKHREALEAERKRKDEEAQEAFIRARLLLHYKKHNPDKVGNVDKILEVYRGRTEVLDQKLKDKYGEGFLPKIAVKKQTNMLLSAVNRGVQDKRQQIVKSHRARIAAKNRLDKYGGAFNLGDRVAVHVSADEVLPLLCAEHLTLAKAKQKPRHDYHSSQSDVPLQFCLVDSRPDEVTKEEGKFQTAAMLSPEALMDPDRTQKEVEKFESLRGAAHICIMGEGFSSLNKLYNHQLAPKEKVLADEDDSRTNLCALFFIKKGFPFVSILDGGFAAAHAWLVRDGANKGLQTSSLIVGYEEDTSLYAQLEIAYRQKQELANATTGEKTTRALQKLMENSMTRLTVTENRIESFYAEVVQREGRQKVAQSMSKFFSRGRAKGNEGEADDGTPEMESKNLSAGNSKVVKDPYGPPMDDEEELKKAPAAVASAGEGIRNAMARFRAAKKESDASKGDASGNDDEEKPKSNVLRRMRWGARKDEAA